MQCHRACGYNPLLLLCFLSCWQLNKIKYLVYIDENVQFLPFFEYFRLMVWLRSRMLFLSCRSSHTWPFPILSQMHTTKRRQSEAIAHIPGRLSRARLYTLCLFPALMCLLPIVARCLSVHALYNRCGSVCVCVARCTFSGAVYPSIMCVCSPVFCGSLCGSVCAFFFLVVFVYIKTRWTLSACLWVRSICLYAFMLSGSVLYVCVLRRSPASVSTLCDAPICPDHSGSLFDLCALWRLFSAL